MVGFGETCSDLSKGWKAENITPCADFRSQVNEYSTAIERGGIHI